MESAATLDVEVDRLRARRGAGARVVEPARSLSDSEDGVSEGPCCETGGFLDPARDGGLVLAREEGARVVDLPREEAGAADSAVEKNGHGVPSFFSRLRCSSLYGRSGGDIEVN